MTITSLEQPQLSSSSSLEPGIMPSVSSIKPSNESRAVTSHDENALKGVPVCKKNEQRRGIKEATHQPVDPDVLEELPTPETSRNLENFIVIWLDAHIVSDQLKAAVRTQVNSLEIFQNIEQCVSRINAIETEKIFVIVSDEYYERIALSLECYESVDSIYILCSNQDKYNQCVEDHSIRTKFKKFVDVFDNIDEICKEIKERSISYARQIPTLVSIPRRRLTVMRRAAVINKLKASFMYSQLIRDILINMTHNEKAERDLINLFRSYYRDNEVGLRRIHEFELYYCPRNAIWWYTKEYFLYGTLNKALRTQDIDTLYKMRSFITDLHRQLEQLCQQSIHIAPFKVFRGQCMSKKDFETHSLNVGGLISFSNLLSCSKDINVALAYVSSQDQNENTVPVLLQISVDPQVRNTLFADITDVSYYGTRELEFLFSMGTIFRIRLVHSWCHDHRVKVFDLLLTNDEDEDLKKLREHMKEEIGGTNNLVNFGRLLIEMGNLSQSEQFYKIVLQETNLKDDPRTVAMIYNELGYIASQQNLKKKSLKLYKKALSIGHERFPLKDAQLSTFLNNIGGIYFDLKDFDQAEEYYKEALEIDKNVDNKCNQAIRYHNIGMVYQEKQNFKIALKNFNNSLELKQSKLSPRHPSIAISFRSIGNIYRLQDRFEEALQYCSKALEIEMDSLPPYHLSLSMTHYCIALIHYDQQQFKDALNVMTTAHDIAKKTLPATHPDIIEMGKYITKINEEISNTLENHIS